MVDTALQELTSWHSYSSIYALGHPETDPIFTQPVEIQEKVDGSQFSFGKFGDQIKVRSKSREFPINAPESMFQLAVNSVLEIQDLLKEGYCYRCEYLSKPKHNTLQYSRIPTKNLLVFDISIGYQRFLEDPAEREEEANRLGLEVTPTFFRGLYNEGVNDLYKLIEGDSCLGGSIEGVVVKSYGQFDSKKKVLMGKLVGKDFKERHEKEWKKENPGHTDVIEELIKTLSTEARYKKAVQHLREDGVLVGSEQDIGNLINEVKRDIDKEELEFISQKLLEWALPKIKRGLTKKVPDWYKNLLLEKFD
jgi:hypothetical protein